jgi:hypothetical protein
MNHLVRIEAETDKAFLVVDTLWEINRAWIAKHLIKIDIYDNSPERIINLALKKGVIEKKDTEYYFNDLLLGNDYETIEWYLMCNVDLYLLIKDKALGEAYES